MNKNLIKTVARRVAAAAACKAVVAFAIIKSTSLETNFVAIVVQFVCSPCAF